MTQSCASSTKVLGDVCGVSRRCCSSAGSLASVSLPLPSNFRSLSHGSNRIRQQLVVPLCRELPVGRLLVQRNPGGQTLAAGVRSDAETSSSTPVAINARDLGLTVLGDKGEEIVVLRGCSLQIPEGQLWMLLGPNGCGKSSLLKVLTGLLRPNRGKLYIVGPRSFVFQNPDHQVVMPTAEADVAFGLGNLVLSDEEVRTRVDTALEAVGMSEYARRPVQTLSGGQKQRVAIAGALAESSRMLLLDELTTFLDEEDQLGVLEAVRKVVGGSVTALWVTHRLEELDYADGAVYMENGRVVLSGSVEDVKRYIRKQQEQMNGNGGLR
ncbi:hypothetical protein M758_1G179200 [Ceratodon purpureus]|uniref:ABC transporter domain-containing protein n=1 Tax=Ceratodon purpureus TaxID=3225 RepID=A0A8T0J7B1_CERPU|nr:hypothetical protein KC19_1G182200 [Ceratodon purpureus]KAG0630455.1 hypothetical protein M758_1G179200 [Ceratodon purpureus]